MLLSQRFPAVTKKKGGAANPLPIELVHEMGEFVGEHTRAGRLVDDGELGGSKVSMRAQTHSIQFKGDARPQTALRRVASGLPGVILLLVLWLAPCSLWAVPVPPTDNTAPPYMGMYVGSFWGSTSSAPARIDFAADWLHRNSLWGEEFMEYDSWSKIEAANDGIFAYITGWLNGDPENRVVVLSVPMLPGYINSEGYGVPTGGTLAQGATGTHNSHFQALAQRLAARTLSNGVPLTDRTIIRLGWEFNGRWYPWRVLTAQEAGDFAGYWQQIVTTMRNVPGAEGLRFCWNGIPGWTAYNLSTAYPGNAYVDYIGVDVYDHSWSQYPYNSTDPDVVLQKRKDAWNNDYGTSWNNGLIWWRDFAQTQGRPLAIPEWGVMDRADNYGGLDNDYFVQRMYDFIHEPTNNVAWHVLWDHNNSTAISRVSPYPGYTVTFPAASSLIQQLFSVHPGGGGEILVDNTAGTGVTVTGTWTSSTSVSGYLGSDYLHDGNTGKGSKSMRYTPAIPSTGSYAVYARWTSGGNRASNVPIDIVHAGSTSTITVNQQHNGGTWNLLGTYSFNAGTSGSVLIRTTGTSGYVIADAVRFVRLDEIVMDNTSSSGVTVSGTWTASTSTSGYLGSNYLHDGNTGLISGQSDKSVTYRPSIPATGTYQVYIRWASGSNRASNVPVDILPAGSPDHVQVNQRQNGGTWNLIGPYTFNAGTSGSVVIRNTGANGYVIADGVGFVRLP